MFKKIIGLVFLFCFAFSLDAGAIQRSARHSASTTNKKIKKPAVRKKRAIRAPRKRRQRAVKARNRSQRLSRTRARSQRLSRNRTRPQSLRRRGRQPAPVPVSPPPPPTYLSKLKLHTQHNAQLAGFDRLYAKGYYGHGTAAVIEYSGGWGEIHSIKQGGGSFS